jgi:hypothetical protein
MQMKPTLRIGVVLFALTMLATYVVYSQLQQTRRVAPGSKGGTLETVRQAPSPPVTNGSLQRQVVAPSSKSRAPLILMPSAPAGRSQVEQRSELVVSGSKSAPVFDPRQAQAPALPKLPPYQEGTNPASIFKK